MVSPGITGVIVSFGFTGVIVSLGLTGVIVSVGVGAGVGFGCGSFLHDAGPTSSIRPSINTAAYCMAMRTKFDLYCLITSLICLSLQKYVIFRENKKKCQILRIIGHGCSAVALEKVQRNWFFVGKSVILQSYPISGSRFFNNNDDISL